MSDTSFSNDRFINGLVADLKPVAPLRPAWQRALGWLALVGAIAAVLVAFANMPAVTERLMGAPDMWLSVVGSTLTAVLATFAAFQLALPDRSPWWAVLPAPALLLWLCASGLGCARTWLLPEASDASLVETAGCLRFIVGLSIPLSVVILLMLRRGYSLYPTLMGGTAGLAVAAAAASLLVLFHPFDATVTDLSVHALAVLAVVTANRFVARAMLARKERKRGLLSA